MENKEVTAPHTGNLLRKYVKEKRIRIAGWARMQGVDARVAATYLKNPDIRCSTLFKISQALSYNFFYDIAALLPADMPRKIIAQDDEITALKKENEILKTQVELMKEILSKRGV